MSVYRYMLAFHSIHHGSYDFAGEAPRSDQRSLSSLRIELHGLIGFELQVPSGLQVP